MEIAIIMFIIGVIVGSLIVRGYWKNHYNTLIVMKNTEPVFKLSNKELKSLNKKLKYFEDNDKENG